MGGSGAGSVSGGVRALPKSAVEDALRGFERARTARKLKVSVRSHLIGALTQIPARPVRPLAPLFHQLACLGTRVVSV